MSQDSFDVDLDSLDAFGNRTLDELSGRVDQLRARLSGTEVPGHAYTTTEPGRAGADSHRAVVDGFDRRLSLATQQLDTLRERLRESADEYRSRDASSTGRITSAGDGFDGGH